jgi:hypothetical protein
MTYAGRRAISTAAVLLALVALALAARPAAAAPIGSDGVVHACYKAKGKPKGAVRVVKPGKACKTKKGEKAIAWTVFGSPGTSGSTGSTGTPGTTAATQKDLLALLGLIQQQAALIDSLTGQLGALGLDIDSLQQILNGVTNGELQSVIASLPLVGDLCDQLSAVTNQANALRTVISGLGLNGALTLIGGLLQIPALPAALNPFSCPAV